MNARCWMGLVLLMAGPVVTAGASEPTPAERATYNRLVAERDALHRKLDQLDRQAADALKQGRRPVAVHAEQAAVQDQLDLLELRLGVIATRHGLAVPPPPSPRDAVASERQRTERAFDRGRRRTLAELREQTRNMLARLDFRAFLHHRDVGHAAVADPDREADR